MSEFGTPLAEQAASHQNPEPDTPVTDELNRVRAAVQALCPAGATITFDFDNRLRLHVDTRRMEDLARLETLLPTTCDGIFSHIQRGLVDNHPFLHRLTAQVRR